MNTEHWWNGSDGAKLVPVSFCPPQILQKLVPVTKCLKQGTTFQIVSFFQAFPLDLFYEHSFPVTKQHAPTI